MTKYEWRAAISVRSDVRKYKADTPIGQVSVVKFKSRAGAGWRPMLPDGRKGPGFDGSNEAIAEAERLIAIEIDREAV